LFLFKNYSFRLVDASRKLDTIDGATTLRSIANHLRRLGTVQQACDILRRLEDHSALAAILVETGAWTEALALVKQHPSLNRDVYLPYARWLAEQEKFIEAQQGWLTYYFMRINTPFSRAHYLAVDLENIFNSE
jgi:intraflagellar transport protein 122